MRSNRDEYQPFISDSDEFMAGIENKEAGILKGGEKEMASEYRMSLAWNGDSTNRSSSRTRPRFVDRLQQVYISRIETSKSKKSRRTSRFDVMIA